MRSSVGCSWRCATACVQNSVYSVHRVHRPEELLFGRVAALRAHHVVGPAQQVVAVFGRDAEHVADQHHRERRGDVAHEVALAPLAHPVDDRVALVADVVLAVADAAGREAAVHELAPLPVLGIVHVDHHRERTRVGPDAARVRERRRVLRRAEHRRVAREAPHVVRGVEVHGRVRAHPRVGRVRVAGVEGAVEQVDVGSRGVGHHASVPGRVRARRRAGPAPSVGRPPSLTESCAGSSSVDGHRPLDAERRVERDERRCPTCRAPIRGRRCRDTASCRGSPTGSRCTRRAAPAPARPSRAGWSRRHPRDGESGRVST